MICIIDASLLQRASNATSRRYIQSSQPNQIQENVEEQACFLCALHPLSSNASKSEGADDWQRMLVAQPGAHPWVPLWAYTSVSKEYFQQHALPNLTWMAAGLARRVPQACLSFSLFGSRGTWCFAG